MDKRQNFWGKWLLEFDLGRYFGVAVPQFIVLLAIFIKQQFPDAGWGIYVLMIIGAVLGVWLLGFVILRSGLYERYQTEIPAFRKLFGKGKGEDD